MAPLDCSICAIEFLGQGPVGGLLSNRNLSLRHGPDACLNKKREGLAVESSNRREGLAVESSNRREGLAVVSSDRRSEILLFLHSHS